MAEKESRCVSTLNEFLEWAAQFNDGQYLFRGVKNETYKIEASASRRLPEEYGSNPNRLLRINEQLIEDARSGGHDEKDVRTLSDLELLAELQHFGAATCLIDFTRSALAALWFACESGTKKENGANGKVVAVRRDVRLRTVTSDLIKKPIDHFFGSNRDSSYPLFHWEPKLQNNRIIAQHSVFVFGGASINMEATCVISMSSKQEILKSLNQISDITEASMYPDFDGFARLHAQNKPYIEPDADTIVLRGVQAHQRDDLADAIDYYTEVISSGAADTSVTARVYYNRGLAYRDNSESESDRAIADFDKAIELRPDYAEAYYNRGLAYRDNSENDRAIADFNKAIELKPDYAEAYYNRGSAYRDERERDLAIADFDKAIELRPDYAEAYYNRGLAYRDNSENDHAIADFDKAIELKSDYAEAYYNRGSAYRDKGESDLAIADFDKAIELKSDYAQAYYNRGLAYQDKGENDHAIADFDKAIELKSDYAEAYYSRGSAYRDEGESDLAIADFDKAIELDSDYAEAYYNRGLAYRGKGKNDRAIEDFDKAIELDSDYAEAYFNRGLAYWDKGENDRAEADFTKAVELDPDDIEFRHHLRIARQRRHD